jgi:hypothetical protein
MKKLLIKQVLVLSLLFVSAFAYSQNATLLKYNFIKGKTYVLSTQLTNNVTQSMGGQEMKMESGVVTNSEMKIEDIDKDGNATTLLSILNGSIHMKIPAMGRDTTMKLSDLKEQIRVVLSSTGKKISEAEVNKDNRFAMMGPINQFTKFRELPGKEIKVGEKWNEKLSDSTKASGQNPFNTTILTDLEYTMVGKEMKDGKELIKISFTGTLAINGKGNQQGMDLFMEGTGKTEGSSYFDPQTLLVNYNEANTEMDMSIAVSGQQNMTMPMTQSVKVINTIEEKK